MTLSDTINSRVGDLLLHVESLEYCTKTAIIRNATGADIDLEDILGYYLIAGTNSADYNLAVSGNEGDVLGILLDGPLPMTISNNANSADKYQVLIHAPCIVNSDKLKANDTNAAVYVKATAITALEALGFEFRTGASKSTTQST